MSSIIIGFFKVFGSVTEAFSGTFKDENKEIKKMKDELETEHIPSISADRLNLKRDGQNVSRDYQSAYEKRNEFCM